MKKKGKVFIGFKNRYGFFGHITSGFEALGYKCLTAVHQPSDAQDEPVQYDLSSIACPTQNAYHSKFFSFIVQRLHQMENHQFLWNKAIAECDIFVFLEGTFSDNLALDLFELKKRGKKIIYIFNEHDIRWSSALKRDFSRHRLHNAVLSEQQDTKDFEALINRIRVVERLADLIVAPVHSGQLLMRPFLPLVPPSNVYAQNTACIQHNRPLVMHTMHDQRNGGSAHIVAAFERLSWQGVDADFEIVRDSSENDALSHYLRCDIAVDQILCPGGNQLTANLLALGKVVCSLAAKQYETSGVSAAVVPVTIETLDSVLKSLIIDFERRIKISKDSIEYVKLNLNPERICSYWLNALENPKSTQLFHPDFYFKHFRLDSGNLRDLCVAYEKVVADQPWYQESITG